MHPRSPYIALLLALIAAATLCSERCLGQSPVAVRVMTAAERLPEGSHAVALYADNEVHSLYYIAFDRLFRYDVLTDVITEVQLSTDGYLAIREAQVFDNGRHFFAIIDVDGGRMGNTCELWKIEPASAKARRVAQGYTIEKRETCYSVRRNISIIDAHAAEKDRRWRAREEYFDFSGTMIRAFEEYDNGPI